MRKWALWSLVAWGTLLVGVGCGKAASSTGSNTNWLHSCDTDADCPAAGACWCHLCTTACGADSECRSGACRDGDNLGCEVASSSSPSVCVSPCTVPADCRSLGSDLDCVNGACVFGSLGAAGSGAASGAGSGGISGAAGRGVGSGGAGDGGAAGGRAGSDGLGGSGSGGGGAGGSGAGGSGAESGASDAGGPPVGGEPTPSGERLAISHLHACTIVSGEAWCWGSGYDGQLGDGNTGGQGVAVLAAGPSAVVGVAVSNEHSCALTQQGEVYCWGSNVAGQIGGPSAAARTCVTLDESQLDQPCQPTPSRVEGVAGAVRIAVSSGRSCALLVDGSLRCWGNVDAFASWVSAVAGAKSVAVGADGACVTTADDQLSCSFTVPEPPPLQRIRLASDAVRDLGPLTPPSPTLDFACMLGTDAEVRCFGDNTMGELGGGTLAPEAGFTQVLVDAKELVLGAAHACALGRDGLVRCWGRNSSAAVGRPPSTSYTCGADTCEGAPVEVFGLPPIATVAAGGDRTCAIATDDTVWCWGYDTIGNGAGRDRIPGPWDQGPASCENLSDERIATFFNLLTSDDVQCVTDGDCVEVPLDVSCAHSCAYEAVSRTAADALAAGLVDLDSTQCAALAAAGCSSPEVTCDTHMTQVACVNSACTQVDPAHNGCDDACGCDLARRAAYESTFSSQSPCTGPDLWPLESAQCGACEGSSVAVVIKNSGSEAFSGNAKVSFESVLPELDPPAFPDPVMVSLDLAPGELSRPIHAVSLGAGTAYVRITGSGDCDIGDNGLRLDLPSPTNPCN